MTDNLSICYFQTIFQQIFTTLVKHTPIQHLANLYNKTSEEQKNIKKIKKTCIILSKKRSLSSFQWLPITTLEKLWK